MDLLYGPEFDDILRRGTDFYLVDLMQSTVAVADEAGTLRVTYAYEPFGRVSGAGPSENPLQFIGRENDGTGLYYHRLRYYSPSLHRYISQDPLGLRGGDENFYAYALNNPVALRDFTGGPVAGGVLLVLVGKAAIGMVSGGVGGYITSGTVKGTVIGAAVGGVVGAATHPIASETAGAATAGVLSSAAGQVAGNLAEGKDPGHNFSVVAVAAAGTGSALGTTVTAAAVPRVAQGAANLAGAVVSRPQALETARMAGTAAGVVTKGVIDGAFTGTGELAGAKLQAGMARARPSKPAAILWPVPPDVFQLAP